MTEAPRKAFVCGHPIAHSRSPKIHGYWLREYGIDGSYEALDIPPADFPSFIDRLPESGFAGGNVTIPHKEAAFRLADRCDEAAELIGAVNTLWCVDGQVLATNTDAAGFAANLDERAPGWDQATSAVVLGAGGAARAVVFALVERGIRDIRVVNRTPERAHNLADRFGGGVRGFGMEQCGELCADAGLLVNTTSLGMGANRDLPVDPAGLPAHAVVADIVYVPLETPLLLAAAARGLRTVDGLGMLLHQAVPGFELWFGHRPVVTPALRELIVANIEAGK